MCFLIMNALWSETLASHGHRGWADCAFCTVPNGGSLFNLTARPILDATYQTEIAQFRALYETRNGNGRATSDIADAARAATYGAIEALLVEIDNVVPGPWMR